MQEWTSPHLSGSCVDCTGPSVIVTVWRMTRLALRRIMLVCWIALSVAVAPVASAWAAMHGAMAPSGHQLNASHSVAAADNGMDMADTAAMPDCHKTKKSSKSSSGCPCCDSKAPCPADAGCMGKCCKTLGGIVGPATRLARRVMAHDRLAEPDKPPEWLSAPPSPPPRT